MVLLALAACGPPAQYRFGTNVTGLRFKPIDFTEGVYPSTSVTRDPANPFRFAGPNLKSQPDGGVGTKWQLLGSVGGVPAFYAFATALTQEPTGENQFYTAQMLGEIAQSGAFADEVTEAQVRDMAIAGYRASLDYFPHSVSYQGDGVTFFSIDVLAFQGAVGLGSPMRGYQLIEGIDGGEASVVRTTDYTAPDGGR
ncbi:MAG: hypothetical protein Q8L48_06080 [Archangium sp.]|nr:hypothetical protein [Archangium sp.]